MTTKIVCRLLTEEHRLLGWVEHGASIRGDGCLRANGPVSIPISESGQVVMVSLHWCDVNVETRIPLHVWVEPGVALTVFPDQAPMITVGLMPGPLPAVTVGRPIAVSIPVGALGARG
jgi:hypothetical protein